MAFDTGIGTSVPPMQCPYMVGSGLCRKTEGHRGKHLPGEFTAGHIQVISDHRARSICNRIRAAVHGKRVWPRPRPHCPQCRAIPDGFRQGAPSAPILIGETGQVVREWDLSFTPCGHTFRWISELRTS